jgi:DHA3 family macrolide efflux protein-like MFS transporter
LIAPLDTLLPYFVRFDHFGGVEDLAFVFAFVQAGMLAGGLLMSLIKGFKKEKMTMIALFIYIFFLVYAFLAYTPTGLIWFMAIGGLIMLFCIPVVNVLYMTIIQTVVPMEIQGRVNSVDMALSNAARPLGMIISGPIAEFAGTANLFLGCAFSGIVVVTISWLFTDIRDVEKMGETSTEAQTVRP